MIYDRNIASNGKGFEDLISIQAYLVMMIIEIEDSFSLVETYLYSCYLNGSHAGYVCAVLTLWRMFNIVDVVITFGENNDYYGRMLQTTLWSIFSTFANDAISTV